MGRKRGEDRVMVTRGGMAGRARGVRSVGVRRCADCRESERLGSCAARRCRRRQRLAVSGHGGLEGGGGWLEYARIG